MSCKSCMESLKKDPLFAVAMVKLWWAMVNLWREQGNTVIMVIYSDHQRSILNVYASVSMYCAGLASTPPVEVHQRPSVCPASGVNSLDGTRHCQKRKVKPLNNGETCRSPTHLDVGWYILKTIILLKWYIHFHFHDIIGLCIVFGASTSFVQPKHTNTMTSTKTMSRANSLASALLKIKQVFFLGKIHMSTMACKHAAGPFHWKIIAPFPTRTTATFNPSHPLSLFRILSYRFNLPSYN